MMTHEWKEKKYGIYSKQSSNNNGEHHRKEQNQTEGYDDDVEHQQHRSMDQDSDFYYEL